MAPLIYRRRPLMIKPLQPGFRPRKNRPTSLRRRGCMVFHWRSRIGGGERSEPISRMPIMPYDTESKSRNADFINIAQGAIPSPSARQGCRPLSGSEHNPSTQPAALAAPPLLLICGEAATTTLGAEGPIKLKNPWAEGPSILRTFPSEPFEPSEPSEPSHRRCVQRCVQRRRATSPRTSRLL